MSRIKLNQHEVLGLFTSVVGVLIAIIPQFGPEKQAILAGGGAVIGAGFLAAGAVKRLADSHVSLALVVADLKAAVEKMLEQAPQPKAARKPKAVLVTTDGITHESTATATDAPEAK